MHLPFGDHPSTRRWVEKNANSPSPQRSSVFAVFFFDKLRCDPMIGWKAETKWPQLPTVQPFAFQRQILTTFFLFEFLARRENWKTGARFSLKLMVYCCFLATEKISVSQTMEKYPNAQDAGKSGASKKKSIFAGEYLCQETCHKQTNHSLLQISYTWRV